MLSKNKLIDKLQILNKNKQTEVRSKISQLNIKRDELIKEIEVIRIRAGELSNQQNEHKVYTYRNKFTNKQIDKKDINEYKFVLQGFDNQIKECNQVIKQLQSEVYELNNTISQLNKQLKMYAVKNEKYIKVKSFYDK